MANPSVHSPTPAESAEAEAKALLAVQSIPAHPYHTDDESDVKPAAPKKAVKVAKKAP